MRKLIIATLAAASLIVAVASPASAGCRGVWVGGRYVTVCGPGF